MFLKQNHWPFYDARECSLGRKGGSRKEVNAVGSVNVAGPYGVSVEWF